MHMDEATHTEELEDVQVVLDDVLEPIESADAEPRDDRRFLLGVTEALIFASREPLTPDQFASALGNGARAELHDLVRELNLEYERDGRAFEILHVAGGYQMFTRKDYSGTLRKLFTDRARTRLSRAALETLAVVAYRGPVTRAEVDEIRGVDCGAVLRTLLDRRLVAIRGRANVIGRPMIYETTPEFLKHFGLSDLSDLPRDSELLREWGESRPTECSDEAPVENGDRVGDDAVFSHSEDGRECILSEETDGGRDSQP